MDQTGLKAILVAIETEKKYRLTKSQFEEVAASLKDLGAEFVREEFEVNDLYGGGILEEEKAVLRVRKVNNKTILTYKRNIRNHLGVKQHTEFETEVADSQAIESIIGALGFRLGMVYEKRRQTWHLQGVEVLLDVLPFGLFMEIEGTLSQIGLIEMMLEIEAFEIEHNTYPKLTWELSEIINGIPQARFER